MQTQERVWEYLELPAISNLNHFPLDLLLFSQPFILGYLLLPAISNYIFVSLGPNQPRLSRTLMTKFMNKRQKVSEHSWKVY